MARRSISIEEKIEAQKELVSKAKDRYEAELDKLEKLMRKRDELRSKELWRHLPTVNVLLRK